MEGTVEKDKLLSIVLDGPVMNKWSVQCETNSDGKLLGVIDNHAELAGDLMYALFEVSRWKDDGRYSAKACGEKACNAIVSIVNDFIDYMDDDDLRNLCDTINKIQA